MKNTKTNYYVIGGQYSYVCYGAAKTILEAKRLAGKHDEYWDNWQGWHKPCIYRAEDCVKIDNAVFPARGAWPVCSYDYASEKWN